MMCWHDLKREMKKHVRPSWLSVVHVFRRLKLEVDDLSCDDARTSSSLYVKLSERELVV
jgi:hypothetical protein